MIERASGLWRHRHRSPRVRAQRSGRHSATPPPQLRRLARGRVAPKKTSMQYHPPSMSGHLPWQSPISHALTAARRGLGQPWGPRPGYIRSSRNTRRGTHATSLPGMSAHCPGAGGGSKCCPTPKPKMVGVCPPP
jgi:hypothetical protein